MSMRIQLALMIATGIVAMWLAGTYFLLLKSAIIAVLWFLLVPILILVLYIKGEKV